MHAGDLLATRAHLSPEREALYDATTGRRMTYAQLDSRANRAASLLIDSLGVRKGDRVSILAYNSIAHVDLFYAVGKIGAVLAPLNWRLTAEELTYIINDASPRVLVVGPELVEVYEELRDRIDVPIVLGLEGAKIDGCGSYEAALGDAPDAAIEPPAGLSGEDPYAILYTSGTTGAPKGAIIPHRQVLWNCIGTLASWGLTERDASPILTPLFHAEASSRS